ncbi:heteroproteinous nuclear ribonucleoprotein A0 [Pestalotiopsis sp. 9143b]|nr:heteroproteinous nuclear ribonucleoprotein A0 [Pestalotiopsis sp. 9143b]
MSDAVTLRAQAAVFAPVADGAVAITDTTGAQVTKSVTAVDGAGAGADRTTTTSEKPDNQASQNGVVAVSEQESDGANIILESADQKANVVGGDRHTPAHNQHPAGRDIVARDNYQHYQVNTAVYGGHGYNHNYSPAAAGPMVARPTNYFNGAPSGPFLNSGATGNMVPQGQTQLSAGNDPISEGRRIYIGNLDYSVGRYDIKKLLRAFFVYNTVEKIYMPYAEPDAEYGFHGRFHNQGRFNDDGFGDQDGGRLNELPNKGYVFVTYTDPSEAEAAIHRLGGVMHFDRKLVCRPGLPKGVAFRSDEMGNGGRFRKNRYRRDPFSDNWDGPSGDNSVYGGHGARRDSYGGRGNGHYKQIGYGNKYHYGADSGYDHPHRNHYGGYNGGYGNNYRGGNNTYGGGYNTYGGGGFNHY